MSDFFDEKETEIIRAANNAMLESYMSLKDHYSDIIRKLNEQISELQQFAAVSAVKKLTVENADLRSEITVLKRRYQNLESQSQRQPNQKVPPSAPVQTAPVQTAPSQATPPSSVEKNETEKVKPQIKPKKKDDAQDTSHAPPQPVTLSSMENKTPEVTTVNQTSKIPSPVQNEYESAHNESTHKQMEQYNLFPIQIASGNYYLDPDNGDLFEVLVDPDNIAHGIGDKIRSLKMATIRGKVYYVDTADDKIYNREIDGNIGEHVGRKTNGKAILKK
jgi:hypothetical protein